MANRYWVGGTGTWSTSNLLNWSTTSGGIGGATVPSSADTAIFDSNSGTGTVTTNYSPSITAVTISGPNINLTLGGNLTCSGTFTLTTSALTLSNNVLTCGLFNSNNSNTRSIAFGTGNITLTGSGATIWTTATSTNLTITGTPTVNATYSGSTGTRTIIAGAATGNQISLNVSAGSDIVTTGGVSVFTDLNFTGFTGTLSNLARSIYGNLTISSGMTCTSGAATISFLGTSGTQQITTNGNSTIDFPITFAGTATYQLQDALTIGATRTVTLSTGTLDLNSKVLTTGIFNSNNTNTRSILFGTGNINISGRNTTVLSIGSGTFSITGTPTVNLTGAGVSGETRSISMGNTLTESNVVDLYVKAGADIISSTGVGLWVGTLDFTGFTGTFTRTLANQVYRNLVLASGMTYTATTSSIIFAGTVTSQQNITTGGNTLDFPLTFSGTATYQFQDALTQGSTRAFTFATGTLQLKTGVTNTVGAFATSGTTLKYLRSTVPGTQATISQSSGTVNVSYLSIQDNNATGGIWQAPSNQNNIIVSNVTGWFTSALFNSIISESGVASDVQLTLNSLTINEFGNALDTQSETISALVSLTESGNAIDTISENMTAQGVIAETGNALDSQSEAMSAPVNINEAGNAADAQSENMSATATINEAANAIDSQSETMTAGVSISEIGNALDAVTGDMIASVTVTETGNAQDSVSQNVVAYLTVIEAGIAIDYQTENAIALLAIAESGLASDAVSEQMTAYAQMLESANAEDALTANMIAQAHIVEAGLAQDLVNQVLVASANISETALAQDSTNGKTYVIVAVLEQGNAVDIYVCAPIFQKSDLVWHVSPRPTNWQVAQRQNYWQVSPRQDYWQAHE